MGHLRQRCSGTQILERESEWILLALRVIYRAPVVWRQMNLVSALCALPRISEAGQRPGP